MEKEFKVGDTVRFVTYKMDEHGRITDRVMKVTGKLVEIEPVGACQETKFPKYWVKRNGKLYWYSGDNLQLIKFKNQFRRNSDFPTPPQT